ncbi:MAG: bifunctional diaminohydroxyphosphoribosylaminopyrimidine deaminase/5-amino-6-(5-phosphoribosylamino)uracil reductase RibD [Desulfobacterota bacterium]|nr:bifunctional diaminohydroxyphosphoribosylaminopyrimidine deaminase/5-amino-6-(5-phosphoribosylamino)uracil reductase RibD [Thermodesulfobacteriota bacterium]
MPHPFPTEDAYWMKRALRLAEKGRGRTSPNPMVGAVLVKEGRVVGQGYHVRAGEDHAEVVALKKAGPEAKGATLYVNLEPCVHQGRTPPCAPALIQAGVKRVVVGMVDPNPLVQGRGIGLLREAGLQVDVGVCEEASRALNEAFSKYIQSGLPFVSLKVASTLDGKIATPSGESKWITGEESRRFVHRLRNEVDAVVVGVDTVLRDDPLLTARIRGGRDPFRVVLDSRLRTPEGAKVIEERPEKTIIATTSLAPAERIECFAKRGVNLLIVDPIEGRVDLNALLRRLGQMEMVSLMVEGGGQINNAFLSVGLVDKIFLFLAPKLIGGDQAPGIFSGRGVDKLEEAIRVERMQVRRLGEDLLVVGYPRRRCSPES